MWKFTFVCCAELCCRYTCFPLTFFAASSNSNRAKCRQWSKKTFYANFVLHRRIKVAQTTEPPSALHDAEKTHLRSELNKCRASKRKIAQHNLQVIPHSTFHFQKIAFLHLKPTAKPVPMNKHLLFFIFKFEVSLDLRSACCV